MKFRTLILIAAVLCLSLLAISCSNDTETTTEKSETPANTTAAVTTTAKTTRATTKKTTVTTTTVATTTIPQDLIAKLPAKLPDGAAYGIHTRIGLESADDYMGYTDKYTSNVTWSTKGAIYGNAFSAACNMTGKDGKPYKMETTLSLLDPIDPEGAKGIMFYVDFSRMSKNPEQTNVGDGVCASVTINGNSFRSNKNGLRTAEGWYFKDGAWIKTTNVHACRMDVPDKFAGWIYVPISQYWASGKTDSAGTLYDASTGLGMTGVWVSSMCLYTEGYILTDQESITFDEILFVK